MVKKSVMYSNLLVQVIGKMQEKRKSLLWVEMLEKGQVALGGKRLKGRGIRESLTGI